VHVVGLEAVLAGLLPGRQSRARTRCGMIAQVIYRIMPWRASRACRDQKRDFRRLSPSPPTLVVSTSPLRRRSNRSGGAGSVTPHFCASVPGAQQIHLALVGMRHSAPSQGASSATAPPVSPGPGHADRPGIWARYFGCFRSGGDSTTTFRCPPFSRNRIHR